MTATGESTKLEKAARRRLDDFKRKYGGEALHLAYHAALPVALSADLLHLLRINFFLDPPEGLPYTAEVDVLFAPFCHEIGEGLYEIDAKTRDLLLQGLAEEYGQERIREVATLLWQYNEHYSPWASRTGLQRAQQLTALNFLDPPKARQWLAEAATWVGQGPSAEREWFVTMSKEIERRQAIDIMNPLEDGEKGPRVVKSFLLPAIVIAGPPHTGKSVLAYSLAEALRNRGVLHHLFRASPDGEGNWAQDADQETIRLFRVRGIWTETFIEGICRDLESRQFPLLVDMGGLPDERQMPILLRCTHVLLLLRADQEENTQIWHKLVELTGLLPIAQLYSERTGTPAITSPGPVLQGTLVGLERGKPVQGSLFEALVERIASLFASYSLEELRKMHLASAPVEPVIDLDAYVLTGSPQIRRWEPEMLVDLLKDLPINTPLAVYGRGQNWLYAALAAHVYPQEFYFFDPRLGWVSPPLLQIGLHTTSEIQVQVREDEHFTTLWVDIAKKYLDYSQSEQIVFPPIPPERGLILYGAIPHWLLTAIIRLYYYEAEVGWVACYLPQLGSAVIVASRTSDHFLGERIPLRDAMVNLLMQRDKPQEAVALHEQVLPTHQGLGDLREMAATQYSRADVLVQQGESQEALALYEQALRIFQELGDVREVATTRYAMARVLADQGEPREALALYEEALHSYQELEDVQQIAATQFSIANVLVHQDKPQEALALYAQALDSCQSSGDVRNAAVMQHAMADVLVQQGKPQEALALYEQALHTDQELGDVRNAAVTQTAMADVLAHLGRPQEALALYEQALQTCEALGEVREVAITQHSMADVLVQQGRPQEALTLYEQALHAKQMAGDVQQVAVTQYAMANVLRQQGNLQEAMALYKQVLRTSQELGNVREVAAAQHAIANVLRQQGNLQEAMTLYEQVLQTSQESGDVHAMAGTLYTMGRVLVSQDKLEEAISLYEQALRTDQELGDVRGVAVTQSGIAEVLVKQGRLEEAMALFAQALHSCQELGDVREVAVIQTAMADVLMKQDKSQEAISLYEQALRTYEALGDVREVAATQANFGRLLFLQGEHQRALALIWQAYKSLSQTGFTHDSQFVQQLLKNLKRQALASAQFDQLWAQAIDETQPDWLL